MFFQSRPSTTQINFRLLIAILTTGLILLIFGAIQQFPTSYGFISTPVDDSWIHMQFARNLAQGNGFSFNAGDPTPGSTAPLWTVFLAFPVLLNMENVAFAVLFSAICFMLAAYFVYRLTLVWSDGDNWAAAFATLSFVLSGRMIWAGLSGMEITAFTLFSLIAILMYSQRGMDWQAAIWFGLASQIRPEGHLLFGLFGVSALVQIWSLEIVKIKEQKSQLFFKSLRLLIPLGVYVSLCLPYTLFSLFTTGKPLPNTFYAKTGDGFVFRIDVLKTFLLQHWSDNYFLGLFILLGIPAVWKKTRPAVLWPALLVLFYSFSSHGPVHYGRYTMPLTPLLFISASLFLSKCLNHLSTERRRFYTTVVASLIIIGGSVLLPSWYGRLKQNTVEILQVDYEIAKWVVQNTEEDDVIAITDIGIITYWSGRTIFDMAGLVSPEVWSVYEVSNPKAEYTRLLAKSGAKYFAGYSQWHYGLAKTGYLGREVKSFTANAKTILGEQTAVIIELDLPYSPDGSHEIENEREEMIADSIYLAGFSELYLEGDQKHINLFWRSETNLSKDMLFSITLVDDGGFTKWEQVHAPSGGLAPTSYWQPKELVKDWVKLEGLDDVPAGNYEMIVSLATEEAENSSNQIFLMDVQLP
ncbi:MAG: hypothetical protein AAF902_19365 [Chloroflexota bacterium]